MILLAQSARKFCAHQGYRIIERGDAPQELQGSEECRALFPASATCMMKILNEHALESP
ncbi:MAG: hypothetical protein KGL25_10600 [Gammaproteobacteria bacterium]|nr:hypothetical protein [Gammaproteobacteria bacterium]MDE2251837.1 hypothetical protein [Gammaproteobacteria bacterium]